MVSLGIDPSLTGTGIVVVKNGKIIEKALIKSKPVGDLAKDEIDRIKGIVGEVNVYLDKHNPDIIVMEGLAFMARNTSALMQLAGLNYLLRAMFHGHKTWAIVAPSTLKKFILGKGIGDKGLVAMEIYKQYGEELTDNNIADAFVLAMIGQAAITKNPSLTVPQREVCELIRKQI